MSLPQALEEALFDSLSTGTFIDVKFYAFSKRTSSGRVRDPKPLFASSRVLQTVPYFHSLLSDSFSEGKLKDLRGPFPPDQPTELDNHDFLHDNDLEEIVDDAQPTTEIPTTTSEGRGSPSKSQIFGSAFASSFSLGVSQLGSSDGKSPVCAAQSLDPGTHLGKVVVLHDISFVTLKAILFFIYSGEISFTSPGESAKNAQDCSASAKSVYLASDKYDIPQLRALALHWIRSTIRPSDIVQELASDFTAMFPEVREVYLQLLANALCSDDRGSITKNLMSAIRSSVHGNPDSGIDPETRGAIFDMLTKGYTRKTHYPYLSPLPDRPAQWEYLRRALQGSLTSGKFLDGHIKAYRGKGPNYQLARPWTIYFSTASIPPATMNNIRHEWMAPLPGREYDSDSDLEDDEGGESDQPQPYTIGVIFGQPIVQRVPVVKRGAWKTWRATLFFVYSGKIAFSPIRSQGVPRPQPPEPQRMGSCSPKSVLVLAEKIALKRLEDDARKDIKQKVTAENVVTEYFSKFVNSHAPLLHAINSILLEKRTVETDAMVRKRFVESTGDDPHISEALELFLQNMIEVNNRRIIGNYACCYRGYTVLDQPKNGKCQICAAQRSKRHR